MNDNKLICISCILSLVSGVIPIDHAFSFQRAFAFFPFFVLGMIFRKQNLMSKLSKIPYLYAFLGLLIGLVIVRFLPMFVPKFHYVSWRDPILRVIQSVLGLYLCLLIIRVLRIDFVERFAKYGVYTLKRSSYGLWAIRRPCCTGTMCESMGIDLGLGHGRTSSEDKKSAGSVTKRCPHEI